MEVNKKGGKRVGAGRKPTSNPKKTITLYVERNNILKFGSDDKLKDKLYGFISDYGVVVTEPTPLYFDAPKITVKSDEPTQFISSAPKQPISNPVNDYKVELKEAKTISEIEAIMRVIKADYVLNNREKLMFENYAKDLSKEMYTD